jgi:hypothetical protein
MLFGNTLEVIGIGNGFLNGIAAQQLRERMDKWDCMKLKSFCTKKEMVSKHPQSGRKYLLAICQRTDNQNIQEGQKTKLPESMNQ